MRVVIDTNVFISGFFWKGNFCARIIDGWKKRKFELVSSMEIIEELVETLNKFRIPMPQYTIQEWVDDILENAIIVEPVERINAIKNDPDDNKFIEAAIAGRADYLISQDKHLLRLKNHENVKILMPEEFLEIIQ